MIVFSLPICAWVLWAVAQGYRGDSSEVALKWRSYLDSIQRVEQFNLDSIENSFVENGPYNPNTMNLDQWEASGLDGYSAQRLTRYLNAGGRIKSQRDFSRLNIGDSVWRTRVDKLFSWPEETVERSVARIRRLDKSIEVGAPDSVLLWDSGLKPQLIQRWKRFVASGAMLTNASDLAVIYGMDLNWLDENKDSLIWMTEEVYDPLDINSISKGQLADQLACPTWIAEKWLKYRDRLGGFREEHQFWEIGLDTSWVELGMDRLYIGTSFMYIDLNRTPIEELAKHPYIGWELARSIEYYRNRVRPIERLDDLRGLEGWEEGRSMKIKYYLEE